MKKLLTDSLLTFLQQIVGVVLGLAATTIIARYLGPQGQGQYALVILLPTLLYSFCNLGIVSSTVYYIGKKEDNIHTIFKSNFIFALILSGIAVVSGFLIINYFHEEVFQGISYQYLILVLFVLPFMFLNYNLLAIFQGQETFYKYNFINLCERVFLVFFLIISFFILHLDIKGAIGSFIASQIIVTISILFFFANTEIGGFKKGAFSFKYIKKNLNYGYKAYFSNVLAFLHYRVDILIISYFLPSLKVGLYVLAVSLAEKLWIVSKSISSVLFARLSNLNSDKDKTALTVLVTRNILNLSIVGAIFIGMICNYGITIVFGNEYSESVRPFLFLLPGIVLGATSRIISNDFASKGRPEINTYVAVILVIQNIGLNFLLIPKHGVMGAAFASTISYGTNSVIKMIIFSKMNNVKISKLLFLKKSDINFYQYQIRRIKTGIKHPKLS